MSTNPSSTEYLTNVLRQQLLAPDAASMIHAEHNCPVCGHGNVRAHECYGLHDSPNGICYIECRDCGTRGPSFYSEKERAKNAAAIAWMYLVMKNFAKIKLVKAALKDIDNPAKAPPKYNNL